MPSAKWFVVALALIALGLAIPAVRHFRETPPPPPPPVRLTLGAPSGTELGSGDEPLDAALSPDERHIVFVATRDGQSLLWRRRLDDERAEALRGTDGAQMPAWSPSGDAIAFFAAGQLKRLTLADGRMADLAEAPTPAGVTWLADGTMLFAPQANGTIRRIRGNTTTDATSLRPGERAHVFPVASGVRSDFVYTAVRENGRRTVRIVQGESDRELTTTAGHGQMVNDYVLSVRDNAVVAQRIDRDNGTLLGQARPVASGVGVTSTGRGLFLASDQMLVSAFSSPRARELAWLAVDGNRTGVMGEAGDYWQVRLAPDDRHAAVTLVAPLLRTLDIAEVSASGRPNRPLTLALAADSDPVWSADGRRIAFKSLQRGRPMLFTRPVDDANADDEALVEDDATPTDWRGSTLVVQVADPASGFDLAAVDTLRRSRMPLIKSGFNDTDARWSPDQSWMVFVSDESGRPDIYATPRSGKRVRVSFGGGTRPRWSRDGRSIYFLRGSTMMRATRGDAASDQFAPAVTVIDLPGIRDFDVAHVSDRLLAILPVNASTSIPVSVVLNWRSLLTP